MVGFLASAWFALSLDALSSGALSSVALSSEALSSEAFGQHPLRENEKYLEGYLDELLDYRENPVAKRYIMLANLVDALPTWIEDLFIPVLIPDSSLTVPLNLDQEIVIPIDGGEIDMHWHFDDLVFEGLKSFRTFRPLKLLEDGRFTWAGQIDLSELSAHTSATLLDWDLTANIAAKLVNPSLTFEVVIAFNRTRLCGVWGDVLKSSLACASWALANHEEYGISGANVTSLQLNIDDIDLHFNFTGGSFGQDWDDEFASNLEGAFNEQKSNILGNLSTVYSEQGREFANNFLLHQVATMHRESPCTPETVDRHVYPSVNVSRVCVSNNGGYSLKWNYHNCPTHAVSSQTPSFPIDQSRCMDVTQVWPDAVEGQILRVSTEAIAGLHEIIDPPLRYVPDSNAAGFQCSGTTLDYKCNFLSVAPIDPAEHPHVSKVCILNHAGFVMWYEGKNIRTGDWVAQTDHYPINQKKCITMGQTNNAQEGDVFEFKTHAVWGKKQDVDRLVQYSDNGLTATYECRGTTLNYKCHLMVGSDVSSEDTVV